MADGFLQIALQNLTSLIKEEVGLIIGADKEMKKLASTFTTIQAVLEDAELNHLESKPIQNWLLRLTDVTYEIDDILDECATHFSKSKYKPRRYSVERILFCHKIGRRMKEATEKLDAIDADRKMFHLREMNFERPNRVVAARETASLLNEPEHVLGREDDKEKIVDILVNQVKSNREISILPIIGLGGLGKTTLAQLVLKDPRVVEHFDKSIWVCVSDDFDLKNVIKAIIESASGKGSASDLTRLDALQHQLWGLLDQKRYLIALDDVWNDDQEKWYQLRNALSTSSTGSSIVVTTRLRNVAEIMGTLPSYDLKELSEEHCWMLLKHCAFRCDEEEQYPNLVAVGKQIARKCVGVPLAAKALGGLLRFTRTEKEWIHIKDSRILDLPQDKARILPILRLSYHHLPLELRKCFTYCAIFPKDFKISKEKLVHLWMAHGYISSNGTLEVEDVGEQILNELIMRSLLQISERDGEKLTMHDLVHDLAQSLENKVPGTQLGGMSTSKIREVNMSKHYMAFPTSTQFEMDITSILKDYDRLRVLRAGGEKMHALPSTIGNLKHLRQLNLSRSNIRSLPSAICNLWNLEVLNLNYCSKLVCFPKKMRCLKNLRHLLCEECYHLVMTPSTLRELTLLRTLSMFLVDDNKGHRLEELEYLNLGGKLEIWFLGRVKNPIDAKKANLVEKHNLRELKLIWDVPDVPNLREDKDKMVLDALQPHPNLECLGIYGFFGKHFANWMKRSSLPKLVKMTMGCCQNLSHLSPVEELAHLESLDLDNLAIEYLGRGGNVVSSHFPALKEIKLYNLCNLKGFLEKEVDQEVCPKLRKLSVQKCPRLVLPPLYTLEDLECDNSSTLASIPKLENLKTLKSRIGKDMECIPGELLEHLTNLETLEIHEAHEQCIPVDGLRGLNSLKTLTIWDSNTLTCLPKAWLCHISTLQEIHIANCSEFVDMPEEIKHLHSLKEIRLFELGKMVCIPDAIKHVYSLELLHLVMLPSLTSLPDWLGDLTSLRSLGIFTCEKIASLPDAIQGMTNLQSIGVGDCPDLKRRCEEGNGEDWHKIAHIPHRYFP